MGRRQTGIPVVTDAQVHEYRLFQGYVSLCKGRLCLDLRITLGNGRTLRKVHTELVRDIEATGRNRCGVILIVLVDGTQTVVDLEVLGDGIISLEDGIKPLDRKSTRLNSSHTDISRMPSSA